MSRIKGDMATFPPPESRRLVDRRIGYYGFDFAGAALLTGRTAMATPTISAGMTPAATANRRLPARYSPAPRPAELAARDWSVESGSCWRALVVARAPAWVALMVAGTRSRRFAAPLRVALIVAGKRSTRLAAPFRTALADPEMRRTTVVR